ncbi:MAG TPA: TatD family hydrolase [Candidatus Paceibacterota bacterium]|nr:TatD family hydrolase [Candidatus Paceibacterota bacterium]
MDIFDSHCHPQFPQYEDDREEMIARASGAGVSMICVGTDKDTSKQAVDLAQAHDNMWAAVGLHPNDNLEEDFFEGAYRDMLAMPKVVAAGEIGLDYYRTEDELLQRRQREHFDDQLALAKEFNMPIILHCRDGKSGSTGRANRDMLEMLINNCPNGGVVHSFTGTLQEAKEFLALDLHLGFNGIITFARNYDEVVRYAPLDRILLETDAPFLTPEPYRGKRNEPSYIIEVAKKLAELKNEPLEKVIEQTTENCKKLFRI